ncbi:hypothetical protein CIK05_02805 [Bdellovibrio sp. qaytius]|nr:hypothetical protein CIK05_02805 [Bdellovibrio sp. qaytius]
MKSKQLIILLTAVIVVFTQSSCLKKQNLEDANLGPAVNADSVESVMAEGIGGLSPDEIKRNESSNISAVTTYEDSQTVKIFSQSISVYSIVSDTTKTRFNLDYSKVDHLNSNQSFNNFSYPLDFNNATDVGSQSVGIKSRSELTAKNADKVPFFLYRAFIVMAAYACREAKVTCHNLKTEDSQLSLSPDLADPRICSDTLRCKIPIRKVEYDLVDNNNLTSDGQPERTHYSFLMSSSLPFFSKVLSYCVRGLVQMENRKVLAEDCVNISGFSVGD